MNEQFGFVEEEYRGLSAPKPPTRGVTPLDPHLAK